MPRLSDAQVAERVLGLGATDVATAAGVNPYGTPLELYLTKIGELDPDARVDDASRGRMERGHRMEDVALRWDFDINLEPYERVNRTIWHPTIPFIFCHPDARRKPWTRTKRLIEVKTSARAWKEVPRHVEAQVQVQMAVTGATACEVLVQTFDGPPTRLVVERDEELIAALEDVAVAFWARVQNRVPPPMDGSAGARQWLDRTRWRDEPDLIATPVQRQLIARLLETRRKLAELNAEDDRLRNVITDTMLGSARLYAPGLASVNWTAPYTRRTVRWKEVAAGYRNVITETHKLLDKLDDDEVLPFLRELTEPSGLTEVERLMTTEAEARSFLVTPDEREQADAVR
jgi:putative phage-type endonuclease